MPQPASSRTQVLVSRLARAWGACARVGVGLALAAIGFCAILPQHTQARDASEPPASAATPARKAKDASRPLWRDLSTRQQHALRPLASHWDSLTALHKRKWLAISRNYAKLPPAEQEVLHSRMTDWAALSPQQRIQARHNFAEVKQIPVDERKAKWEAYQALSDEEKRELATQAAPRPVGATATIRPVPARKLAPLPAAASDGRRAPRIQLTPPASASAQPWFAAPAREPAAEPAFPPVAAEEQVPPPSPALPVDTPVTTIPPMPDAE